ncbi:MAG TPA: SHOCT domain-containing protein [Acidimicrobiia bacterium]|nr:SHOCT domain-containing protein [Acidimicrobiia bacterium]
MPLFDLFWSMLWFFLFFMWIWLLISLFADIFRSDDLSGWGKAGWIVFLVAIPWLGALVYLIARGGSMQERTMRDMAAREKANRAYIQGVAGSSGGGSAADELTKLASLRDRGVLTDEEFQAQKAALLG